MKILKFTPLLVILILYNSNSFAKTTKDCSAIKADTGVKMYEKWKCQKGFEGFKKKVKKIFKKKN